MTKKSALIIVDMQNGVVNNTYQKDVIISNINILVEKARQNKIPVIWIQHSSNELKANTPAWDFVSALKPASSEMIIHKIHGDAFEETNLKEELDKLNVKKVYVTGAQTDACIRATIHGAFIRGYDTSLVSDAHTTEDFTSYGFPPPEQIILLTNTYWTWQTAANNIASVEKTEEIVF